MMLCFSEEECDPDVVIIEEKVCSNVGLRSPILNATDEVVSSTDT